MAKQQRASSRSGRSKPADASVSSDSRMLERGRESQGAHHAGRRSHRPCRTRRGRRTLRRRCCRAPGARIFARIGAAAIGAVALSRGTGAPRAGPPVPQRLRAPHGAAGRVPLDTRRAGVRRDAGGQRRELRRGARAPADRQLRSARARSRPLYARVRTRAAGRGRRGRAASAARHRAQSRQSLARASRPRSRRAARVDSVRTALEATSHAKAERRKAARRR